MPQTLETLNLLGWMEEDDARRFLLSQAGLGSGPTDGTSARRLWSDYRDRTMAAAAARDYAPPCCTRVHCPAGERLIKYCGGRVKSIVAVNPAELLAFQFFVSLPRTAEHQAVESSWEERCLPNERLRAALKIEQEGNSLVFDVPHGEHVLILTPEGELRVDQNHPFVMVRDIGDGRLMLRAGYHRAYAYLTAQPRPAEPFLAAVTDHPLVELEIPGMRAKLTSPHPPLVGDFLDPDLVVAAKTPKMRYRFKITAEMNAVPCE